MRSDPGLHRASYEAATQATGGDTKGFDAVMTRALNLAGGPLREGHAVRWVGGS